MKLNNKGFAVSTVMYIILITAVILILAILSILSARKLILDNIKKEVADNINTPGDIVINPDEEYYVYFDPSYIDLYKGQLHEVQIKSSHPDKISLSDTCGNYVIYQINYDGNVDIERNSEYLGDKTCTITATLKDDNGNEKASDEITITMPDEDYYVYFDPSDINLYKGQSIEVQIKSSHPDKISLSDTCGNYVTIDQTKLVSDYKISLSRSTQDIYLGAKECTITATLIDGETSKSSTLSISMEYEYEDEEDCDCVGLETDTICANYTDTGTEYETYTRNITCNKSYLNDEQVIIEYDNFEYNFNSPGNYDINYSFGNFPYSCTISLTEEEC